MVQNRGFSMGTLKVDQDIQSMSDFRSGVSGFVKQVRETKRPLVITQHGKGVAVLLAASEYDAMQEKIELLQAIHAAEQQLVNGKGVEHEAALKQLLAALKAGEKGPTRSWDDKELLSYIKKEATKRVTP